LYTNTKTVVFAERRHAVRGLDLLMADARRKKFSVVLVAAFDRIARSTRNFLQTVDELDSLGIEFVSRREGVATGDAMGRLFVTIISAIAELERSLVVERVKSGMRRAKLEGRQIGRSRLDVNREQVVIDRRSGLSLTQVARKHSISRASVCPPNEGEPTSKCKFLDLTSLRSTNSVGTLDALSQAPPNSGRLSFWDSYSNLELGGLQVFPEIMDFGKAH
jgi:hypothetical protein